MDVDSRQDAILGLLRMQEHAGTENLATHFDVSIQTIRSDLGELSEAGLVDRIRGSIGNINTLFSLFHQEKKEIHSAVQPRSIRNLTDFRRHTQYCSRLWIGLSTRRFLFFQLQVSGREESITL